MGDHDDDAHTQDHVKVVYAKTYTEEEFQKILHPGVYERFKRDGFAEYMNNGAGYFLLDNNRQFIEPPRDNKSTKQLVVCKKATDNLCYAYGICGNQPTDNNTVLCQDCVKLFIRNGVFVVDLFSKASCDDCNAESRSIRVHSSNRQLCMSCFKVSLERLLRKREEEAQKQMQTLYLGMTGFLSLLTGENVKTGK